MEEKKTPDNSGGVFDASNFKFDYPAPPAGTQLIAYTQTINPKMLIGEVTICKQHKIMFPEICRILKRFCKKWYLYPEIQPKSGMLHYHGILYVSSKKDMLNNRPCLIQTVGFTELKPCTDIAGWHEYCTKEAGQTPLNKHCYTNEDYKKDKPTQNTIQSGLRAFGVEIKEI